MNRPKIVCNDMFCNNWLATGESEWINMHNADCKKYEAICPKCYRPAIKLKHRR